ncbi:hypothetical protein PMAYCL1PPCAC_03617, partial [Pristionchus mayeri]
MDPADRVKKEEEGQLEEEGRGRRSKHQEYTQLTPLMTQNGPAGMMMQQQQMYQAGYQMPPSVYPSAPPTPGMVPSGAVPPPTVMYPGAPTPSHLHPGYQGYASGSSTPINPNARSPARSRKAMGMDQTSSWLGQQHPHLGAPGTPGPGSPYASRAPSVMSTMTNFNDDAVSVMSVPNLVELQPATSHQTENIDPARMGPMVEAVTSLAHRLTQPQPDQAYLAACQLAEILSRSNAGAEKLPKQTLDTLIQKSLEALWRMNGAQLESEPVITMLGKLFSILHKLALISSYTRTMIVTVCQTGNIFQFVLNITCQSLRTRVFIRAIAFLNALVRDQHSDYAKGIMSILASDRDFFSFIYTQMINTHISTALEFVCRILKAGDRRALRERLTEKKVQYLLNGSEQHEGLLKRCMRKNEKTNIDNALRIIELLLRMDAGLNPHELDIQKWFINQNLFGYLNECLPSKDQKRITIALNIFANLAGSPHIDDETATKIAFLMVQCVSHRDLKLQNMIIFTLSTVSGKRKNLQRLLVETNALNYACHLIKEYGNKQNIEDMAKNTLIEEALNVCHRQLQLQLPQELATQLWTEGTDKAQLTDLFLN